MSKPVLALTILIPLSLGTAVAADPSATASRAQSPDPVAGAMLRGSIGLRYWNSTASSDISVSGNRMMTSDARPSHSAELVGEFDDDIDGTFFRAYAGIGRNLDGKQTFRGYAANGHQDSGFGYAVIDGGWTLAGTDDQSATLRGFIGYHFLNDEFVGVYRGSKRNLQTNWNALRIGLSAKGQLTSRVGFSADLAAVPWAYHKPKDARSAYTYGVEAEALVHMAVTENWHVGVGGRYWLLQSHYKGTRSAEQTYRRFGLLAESKYAF